jgi:hypothetical protein
MLGLVSTGDAERLGLAQAQLETAGRTYVGPTPAAMARAIRTAEPSESGDAPFVLDMREVVKANAYPGTMIVYTAARTANLPAEDAAKVAEFIEVSTSEGQKTGFGNGELPAGYLPIGKSGVTAPLWKQAQAVAAAVAEQKGAIQTADDTGAGDGEGTGDGTGDGGSTAVGPGSVTTVEEGPATDDGAGKSSGKGAGKGGRKDGGGKLDEGGADADQEPVDMPPTTEVASPVAQRMLPLLLVITLTSAIAANLVRLRHLRRRRA